MLFRSLPSVVLVYFLLVPLGEVAGSVVWFAADLALLALGLAVYGAVFALAGALWWVGGALRATWPAWGSAILPAT